MAVQEQVERLKRSVKEWNQWRRQQSHVCPDLSSANLSSTDLSYASLTRAILTRADLTGANLTRTRLSIANLTKASLYKADLHEADLREAILTGVAFEETILNRVRFGMTTLAWVDLNWVKGLETVVHSGSSAVDINSVILPHDEQTCLITRRVLDRF